MILLYGINQYSLVYHEEKHSDQVLFVTTEPEQRFGEVSLGFDDAITQYPKAQIIVFSTFSDEILASMLSKGLPLDNVFIYNPFAKQKVAARSVIHEYQFTNKEILHCVYDLSTCLVTFDFFLYLVNAEIERIKRGLKYIKLYIVLPLEGAENTINIEYSNFRNGEHANIHYILDRVSGILEPLGRCHAKILSVSQHTKDDFQAVSQHWQSDVVFPENYHQSRILKKFYYSDFESDLRQYCFKIRGFIGPTQASQELVRRFIELNANGRKPVVITLREYDFQHHRNSSSEEWVRFIDELDSDVYFPVIVRDTYKVHTSFPSCNAYIFNEASIDLKIRIALYQQAFVNLSVNCGPSSLFYFLKNCDSIEFRDINPQSMSTTAEQMYSASLMVEGEQPFYALPNHNRVHWGVADYANITKAFYDFISDVHNEEIIR